METSSVNDIPPDAADPLAEETLESRLAWQGSFLRVHQDRVRTPDGHVAIREYLRHPGAVMVVPLLDDGRLLLERQYRYPLRASFVEFPAGKIDPGEDKLACARRELKEETGYVAAEWTHLGGFHNAIGYCDERIDVYLARGLRYEGAAPEAGEVLQIFEATLAELLAWIDAGRVTDAKTIIGACWLRRWMDGGYTA